MLLRKFVDKYKDAEQTRIFLMGDEIDAITRQDKRYTARSMHPRYVEWDNCIDMMVDDLVDILSPLRGKILAGCDSNHNTVYRGYTGSDIHYRLSQRLGFERLGYGGWVCILWDWHKKKSSGANRVRKTVIHMTHGKPTCAITKAGKMAGIERDAWFFSSDIMVHGHTHLLATPPANIFFEPVPGKETYIKKKQRLLNSGSFLKSYSMDDHSPYSEWKRYPPIDMGWGVAEVEFRDGEPLITMFTKEY